MALSEEQIRTLVERFYARVRADAELGPIFAARLDGHWPAHLERMVDFWSSVLLRTGRYSGNPRAVHARIEGLDVAHFVRWLDLFDATLAELFEPEAAAGVARRARAMARGLTAALPGAVRHLPLTEASDDETPGHPA